MEDERIISYERGKQLADQLGVEFFETSAKENINVKAVFVSQMPFLKKLWLE
jgi:Ras-related protein Rab-3C